VADDECVRNGVPHERREERDVPEEPVPQRGVGAPRVVVVVADHPRRDEDDGQDGGKTPATDVKPVEGYLRFLFAAHPNVESDTGGPKERTHEEEVNESTKELTKVDSIGHAIEVMKEEGDLGDGDEEGPAEVGDGEEEDELVQVLLLVGEEDVVDDDGGGAEEGEAGRGEVEAVELELVFA